MEVEDKYTFTEIPLDGALGCTEVFDWIISFSKFIHCRMRLASKGHEV